MCNRGMQESKTTSAATSENNEERESTSLKFRPSIYKRIKIAAIERDMEIGDLLEELMVEYLKKINKAGGGSKA